MQKEFEPVEVVLSSDEIFLLCSILFFAAQVGVINL